MDSRPGHPRPRAALLVALLFLAAAVAEHALYALPSALDLGGLWDFRNCYLLARGFLEARNPYDPEVADFLSQRCFDTPPGAVIAGANWLLLPPGNAVLFAPLALLPYAVAARLWLLLGYVSLWGIARAGQRFLGPRAGAPSFVLSLALLLWAHPVREALWAGQPSLLYVWCALLALDRAAAGRDVAAGAACALALLKYSLALPVLGYLVVKRRWSAVRLAVLGCAVLNVLPLALGDVEAILAHNYENTRASFAEGGLNNQRSPQASYNDVSLPVLLLRLAPEAAEAAVQTAWLGLLALVAGLILGAAARDRAFRLPEIAAGLAFSMMYVYHRNYDSPLLFGVGAAVAGALADPRRARGARWAWGADAAGVGAALLLLPFLFRNPWENLTAGAPLDRMDLLVRLSYRNWSLVALTLLLTGWCWAARGAAGPTAVPVPAPPPGPAPDGAPAAPGTGGNCA
ncbi:MAG: DUF2029 domain-containing protein [Planctomycetes bacterium]|nr:DUF2029 domain-containing protein [Planctomycetota bacterium]